MLFYWSRSDGEQFTGDQEYFFDNPDQQEPFEQRKYNMGSTLLS
jgi:hypothetical protein